MTELHFPWLELLLLFPLVGAARAALLRDPEQARRAAIYYSSMTLAAAVGAWIDFSTLAFSAARDRWDVLVAIFGYDPFVIDELNAPLLSLAALLYLLAAVATSRTKVRRFSFAWTLVSEFILLATFCLDPAQPWGIVALLVAGTAPPWFELRARNKPVRVYVAHMALFVGLLIGGWAMVEAEGDRSDRSLAAVSALMAAVLLRSGIVPVHCWMTDLFEHATFGTALLFVTPMAGAFAAVRLVLPIAPDWALRGIALLSLLTAVYAAGMALVQRDARRFFCYLFLSQSSLVLVGLEIATPIGLAGGLSVWLSVGLALAGFGLTLRSLEARLGRQSLTDFHGLYEQIPSLAALFLLTGLASVGFPGTFGFVGLEMLIDGVVQIYPTVGAAVVLAAALNGIAVLQAYLRLFAGARQPTSISLGPRWAERVAVLVLAALILGGGLWPQPGIVSRYNAALEIIGSRPKSSDAPWNRTSPTGADANEHHAP